MQKHRVMLVMLVTGRWLRIDNGNIPLLEAAGVAEADTDGRPRAMVGDWQ